MSYKAQGRLRTAQENRAAMISRNRKAARQRRATANRRGTYTTALQKTGEKKGMDTIIGDGSSMVNTSNTNDDILVLNLVQQGSGSWNRVGRKIHMQSVRLKGTLQYECTEQTTTANVNVSPVRMILVYDKQPSGGTIPTFDTMFGITTQDGTETSSVMSVVRYDNMSRFQILRDCVYDISPIDAVTTATGSGNIYRYQISFDEYVKLGGRETVFGGQSSPMTIADISTGALYLVFRGIDATDDVAAWTVVANAFARLRYFDT